MQSLHRPTKLVALTGTPRQPSAPSSIGSLAPPTDDQGQHRRAGTTYHFVLVNPNGITFDGGSLANTENVALTDQELIGYSHFAFTDLLSSQLGLSCALIGERADAYQRRRAPCNADAPLAVDVADRAPCNFARTYPRLVAGRSSEVKINDR